MRNSDCRSRAGPQIAGNPRRMWESRHGPPSRSGVLLRCGQAGLGYANQGAPTDAELASLSADASGGISASPRLQDGMRALRVLAHNGRRRLLNPGLSSEIPPAARTQAPCAAMATRVLGRTPDLTYRFISDGATRTRLSGSTARFGSPPLAAVAFGGHLRFPGTSGWLEGASPVGAE